MPLDATIHAVAPVTLADYTLSALVVPCLRERDTAGIIGELSQVLQREGCVTDVLPFYHTALNQELLATSAVESGLAFPHARLGTVKQLRFAFGRAPAPVIWGARGSWRVQLIFLMAVPATDATSSLHLLASIARLAQQPDSLAELRTADNAETILAVLERIRLRPG
jgi:mannitol/fructose-specific phosphotransferase system IIA component (Ntr-type)